MGGEKGNTRDRDMETSEAKTGDKKKKRFYHLHGKTYFDRKMERGFFLILTILVVCYFLLEQLGLFG